MVTALEDNQDNPPDLKKFFREQGITLVAEINVHNKIALQGNWEGHWRKHRVRYLEQLATAESKTLEEMGYQAAQVRARITADRIRMIDDTLPLLLNELRDRVDMLDDKALVGAIKVLTDVQQDMTKQLDNDAKTGKGLTPEREKLFGSLKMTAEVVAHASSLQDSVGREVLGTEADKNPMKALPEGDMQAAFDELNRRVLGKEPEKVTPDNP